MREIDESTLQHPAPVNTLDQPMDIGTVVSTAWRHYRLNFFRYLLPALRGTVWMLVPIGLLFVGLLFMIKQGLSLGDFSGLTALIVPAWFVLLLWCGAQSQGELAGISRSVYQAMSMPEGNAGETLSTALRFTRSRKFSLLGSAVIKGTILAAINFVFSCILIAAVIMIFVGLGVLPGSQPNLRLFFGGGGIVLVSSIVFIWLYIWLALKLLVNEQSLAIESDSGMLISIGHSWKLMRHNVMRSLWIVLLASLITLPISLAMAILTQVVHPLLFEQMGIVITESTALSLGMLPYITFYLLSSILGLVGCIIV